MRVEISSDVFAQITSDAAASPHVEICGLLFGADGAIMRAEPCRNVAVDPSRAFEIDPRQLIAAHRAMRAGGPALIGCYHSHPFGPPEPSLRDAAAAHADGWLWLIVARGGIGLYRASAGGSYHRAFEAVGHEIVPSGCFGDGGRSEGRLSGTAGEARQ